MGYIPARVNNSYGLMHSFHSAEEENYMVPLCLNLSGFKKALIIINVGVIKLPLDLISPLAATNKHLNDRIVR